MILTFKVSLTNCYTQVNHPNRSKPSAFKGKRDVPKLNFVRFNHGQFNHKAFFLRRSLQNIIVSGRPIYELPPYKNPLF